MPEALLCDSLAAPRDSIYALQPLADWVARVDNEQQPRLVSFATVDRTGCWGLMASRFARVEPAAHEFPRALSSIMIDHVAPCALVGWTEQQHASGLSDSTACADAELRCGTDGDDVPVRVMPLALVGIPADTSAGMAAREWMGIPATAVWLSYATIADADADRFRSHFLLAGSFLFFDENTRLVAVAAVSGQQLRPAAENAKRGVFEFDAPVRFGGAASPARAPQSAARAIPAALRQDKRWAAVTLPALKAGGAARYAWVRPGELPEVKGLGGFVYEMADGGQVLFPLRAPTT